MLAVLKSLEVRFFAPKTFIFKELDESSEMYFIQKGYYNVGYEINNVNKYKLQFGSRTQIGGFAMAFNQRHQFIYQSHSSIEGFAIRRKKWF